MERSFKEGPQLSSYEIRDGGHLIVVSFADNPEEVADKIFEILNRLDPQNFEKEAAKTDKEDLLKGKEERPQGIYAVWLDRRNKVFKFQNRNGRGVKEYNDKLEQAVKASF